jgi:hypothetical protein
MYGVVGFFVELSPDTETLQAMSLLLSANMSTRIFTLVLKFPLHLRVLMIFQHLDLWLDDQKCIHYIVNMLANLPHDLAPFALGELQYCDRLWSLPFAGLETLNELIPQKTIPAAQMTNALRSFMLLHQRILVNEAHESLTADPYSVVEFKRSGGHSPLRCFNDYTVLLISKLSACLNTSSSPGEIGNSVVFQLFENLMRLLSSLTDFHPVARLATALLPSLINQLKFLVDGNEGAILYVVFLFGKFASTLVMGGMMTEFEDKYFWLIRANLYLIERADLIADLCAPEFRAQDDILEAFLNGTSQQMLNVHQTMKPHLNRRLSDDMIALD